MFVRGHAVLFLHLCKYDVATPLRLLRVTAFLSGEEHDTFLPELIQWLGLLRNMSHSSYACKCKQKEPHAISYPQWRSGEAYKIF